MDGVSTRAHQSTVPCGLRDRRSGLELDICRPRAADRLAMGLWVRHHDTYVPVPMLRPEHPGGPRGVTPCRMGYRRSSRRREGRPRCLWRCMASGREITVRA